MDEQKSDLEELWAGFKEFSKTIRGRATLILLVVFTNEVVVALWPDGKLIGPLNTLFMGLKALIGIA